MNACKVNDVCRVDCAPFACRETELFHVIEFAVAGFKGSEDIDATDTQRSYYRVGHGVHVNVQA